jgi:hypothetical protein
MELIRSKECGYWDIDHQQSRHIIQEILPPKPGINYYSKKEGSNINGQQA